MMTSPSVAASPSASARGGEEPFAATLRTADDVSTGGNKSVLQPGMSAPSYFIGPVIRRHAAPDPLGRKERR